MIENISGVTPMSSDVVRPVPSSQPRVEAAATPLGNTTAPPISAQAIAVKGINAPESAGTAVDRETLEAATKEVAEFVAGLTNDLKFSIDEDTGAQVVKIVDIKTKEVLRQIPGEEMLAIAKALDKLKGLFIRSTA